MIHRCLPHPALLLLLAIATPLVAGELSVHAPSDIKKLLTPWLPDDSGNQRRLQGQLSEILATEGYFSPAFNFEERDGGLNLTIDPGLRTTITGVDVAVDGNIEPKTKSSLIDSWQLPVGHPFRQDDWNTAKQQILSELLAVEYTDARFYTASFTDPGLAANTNVNDPLLNGKFRVPTLRNIEKTAPYMHNGVFTDLRTIVEFYNSRDTEPQRWGETEYPDTINRSELGNLKLSDREIDAIVAFMKTLTDQI